MSAAMNKDTHKKRETQTVHEKNSPRPGPNGRPIRPFVMPDHFSEKLKVWRYLLYRRALQIGTLLLFFGSAHWGWTLFDEPVLTGNLSASTALGLIPLADPFALAQIISTGHWPIAALFTGAAIVLGIYALVGGRSWCAWVCPINMVSDLAGWLRRKLDVSQSLRFSRNLRYTVLVLTLILSAITGVAAFEWVSPISMLHREVIFGLGMGWVAVLGIFIFDLFVLRDGWCGHLCPLGAFYALLGKLAPLRITFDTPTCTHCGECARVCPEPQVLNLKAAAKNQFIRSGECTNCGRCITVCPEDTLHFGSRPELLSRRIVKPPLHQTEQPKRKPI